MSPCAVSKPKNGSGGAGVGSYLAGGLLLGVVGLGAVALAGRSHNAKIPAGTLITSFVDKDASIDVVMPVQTSVTSNIASEANATPVKSEIASKNSEKTNVDTKAETKD